MYILYKDTQYPCVCRPYKNTIIYRGLPENFSSPVEGEIILCADDGFIMRTDKVEKYLRQTFKNGVLTLTNLPEVKIVIPEVTTPTLEERVASLETELAEAKTANATLEEQLTNTQLALCELYEANI